MIDRASLARVLTDITPNGRGIVYRVSPCDAVHKEDEVGSHEPCDIDEGTRVAGTKLGWKEKDQQD